MRKGGGDHGAQVGGVNLAGLDAAQKGLRLFFGLGLVNFLFLIPGLGRNGPAASGLDAEVVDSSGDSEVALLAP